MVHVYQFKHGTQGELIYRGNADNKVQSMTITESPRAMCSIEPLRRKRIWYIESGGQRWEVIPQDKMGRVVDPERLDHTLLKDLSYKLSISSGWTISWREFCIIIRPKEGN